MYYLEKEFTIACSHRLHNPELSDSENKTLFGKCNNEPSHGHGFKVILKFKSEELDKKSGMVINFYEVKDLFKIHIDDVFDHRFLNDCEEFAGIVTTSENMCKVFYNILSQHTDKLYAVKIFESEGSGVEYSID